MVKRLFIFGLLVSLFFNLAPLARARAGSEEREVESLIEMEESTEAAEATGAALVDVEKRTEIAEVSEKDITQPKTEVVGELENLILSQDLGGLSLTNFMRYGIQRAVGVGVAANTIVLLLLFPIVATMIAVSRHLIGLRGFGIFLPAAVSIAFLSTGLPAGLVMFGVILLVAYFGRGRLKRLRLQYLPRVALLMWLISLVVFGLLLAVGGTFFASFARVGIFPILLFMLLAEEFLSVQAGKNLRQAATLTMETLILAVIGYYLLSLHLLQRLVVLYPELTVLLVGGLNLFVGKYVGLRLLEYWRFRELLKS